MAAQELQLGHPGGDLFDYEVGEFMVEGTMPRRALWSLHMEDPYWMHGIAFESVRLEPLT
jgi:hypothetical protein